MLRHLPICRRPRLKGATLRGKPTPVVAFPTEDRLDKIELKKLQAFLCRSFGNEGIKVVANAKAPDTTADVQFGQRTIGTILLDDEDGDRSFAFEMKIPVNRLVLQDYLRRLFESDKLKIVARAKKTDSVELNSGDEYLGIISADDKQASSFTLQIAILDVDLDDEGL